MAKKKGDIGLARQPKIETRISLSDQGFVLVTPENRKQAVVIGRIFYKIDDKNNCIGHFQIIPLRKKGWVNVPNYPWDMDHPYINGKTHWKYFNEEDENHILWVKRNKDQIDKGIENKNLYIKTSDPILTY